MYVYIYIYGGESKWGNKKNHRFRDSKKMQKLDDLGFCPHHPTSKNQKNIIRYRKMTGWWARATHLKNMTSSIGMIRKPILMGK